PGPAGGPAGPRPRPGLDRRHPAPGRLRGEHRRHGLALEQWPLALDAASGHQQLRHRPLLDALFLPSGPRYGDRPPARLLLGRPAGPLRAGVLWRLPHGPHRRQLRLPQEQLNQRRDRAMAGKQLYFKFVEGGVQGVVELYEADAPQTVAAIWQALARPVRIPAMHAMFAGPEIMLGLPPDAQG